MTATYVVSTDFVARDLYSAKVKQMDAATRKFAADARSRIKSVGQVWKGSFLGTATANAITSGIGKITSALRSSVDAYIGYESALTRASLKFGEGAAIGSAAFKELERGAKAVGMWGDFSAQQAAESYGALAAAGYDVKGAIQALTPIADFAEASAMDLAAATDIAAKSMKLFGVEAGKAARVGDTYLAVSESSRMSVEELYSAVETGGAIFAASGQSLESYLTMIGYLGQRGVPAARSSMAIQGAMVKLTAPTKAGAAALKKLGVATTEIVDGKERFRDFVDIIGDMQDKMSGLDDVAKRKVLSTLFDQRALKTLAPLFDESSAALAAYAARIENSGGRAKKVAETLDTTVSDKLERLKTIAQERGIDIISKIFGGGDIDAVLSAIRKFDVGPIVTAAKALGKALGFMAEHADTVIMLAKGFVAIKVAMAATDAIKWGQNMVAALRGVANAAPALGGLAPAMSPQAAASASRGGTSIPFPSSGGWAYGGYQNPLAGKPIRGPAQGWPINQPKPPPSAAPSTGTDKLGMAGGIVSAAIVGWSVGSAIQVAVQEEGDQAANARADQQKMYDRLLYRAQNASMTPEQLELARKTVDLGMRNNVYGKLATGNAGIGDMFGLVKDSIVGLLSGHDVQSDEKRIYQQMLAAREALAKRAAEQASVQEAQGALQNLNGLPAFQHGTLDINVEIDADTLRAKLKGVKKGGKGAPKINVNKAGKQ